MSRRMKDSGIEWIGEIPEGWMVAPLKSLLESIIDYRGKTPEKVDEGIFLVTAKNIKNGHIDYSLSEEYIKSEDYNVVMRRGQARIGDVLFTTEAPLGEVANVDKEDIALAQRIIKFRGDQSKLNNVFLRFWLSSIGMQQFLKSLATGSTAEGIKASKLFMLKIPLLDLDEQNKIVEFLDIRTNIIDQTIEKLKQIIYKLKEYKQSIITEAVTKGLDANLKMKDGCNEWVYQTPEYWSIIKLKYVCKYQEGPGIMANDFKDSGVPLIRISGIKGDKVSLDGCNYLDEKRVENVWKQFRLELNDIVISASASTGIIASVDENTVGAIPYTGLIRIQPKASIDRRYLIYFLTSDFYINQINIQKTGSTIQHYGPSHLGKVILALPPKEEQRRIADYLDYVLTNINNVLYKQESLMQKFEIFKKSLIYECVTGKREVK